MRELLHGRKLHPLVVQISSQIVAIISCFHRCIYVQLLRNAIKKKEAIFCIGALELEMAILRQSNQPLPSLSARTVLYSTTCFYNDLQM